MKFLSFALASLICVAAHAQTPGVTVRGVIIDVATDTASLTVKSRAGATVPVKLTPKTRILEVTKASAADLKSDSYIGVAAVPDAEGGLRALEVHIFAPSLRGTGEGTRDFDLAPNSSMTNGALSAKVAGVEGDQLTVSYKGGTKTIRLTPKTPIVALGPGSPADLKPEAAAIVRGAKGDDGGIEAAAVIVGKDGVTPPM